MSDDDLMLRIAQALTMRLFGQSWRGLTPDARRLALGEARGVLAVVQPLILDEAMTRVRADLKGVPVLERVERAVRGLA